MKNKKRWMRRLAFVAVLAALWSMGGAYSAQAGTSRGNQVERNDADGNGISDAGVNVTGGYKQSDGGCEYQVQYRGDFGNTPYLDSGWINNEIRCPDGTFNYTIVSAGDPRYTGDPDWAIWGSWEIVRYTESGQGNLVHRPDRPAVG